MDHTGTGFRSVGNYGARPEWPDADEPGDAGGEDEEGRGGEDRLTENVSLNFRECVVKYTPQKADGTADKSMEFKWNIAENVQK